MNLKYLTTGICLIAIYLTPSYLLKKYFDNTKEYFMWRIKILSDEIKDIKKKIDKDLSDN
jgi:hypothetical protein